MVGSISGGRWRIRSNDAGALLQSVARYVVVKRDQAEAAIRYLHHEDSFKNAKHTAAEIAAELEYREQMLGHLSALNQAHRRREEPTGVAATPELAQFIKGDQQRENEEVIDRLNEAAEETKRQIRRKAKPLDDRST
jgi:L-lysine 2,3-aminomutase